MNELGFFKGLTYFGISLEFWLRFSEGLVIFVLFIVVLRRPITILIVDGLPTIKKFFSGLWRKDRNG